jgi:hypothetical protein
MSGVATAIVASAVIGGVVASKASSKASDAQVQSGQEANTLQKQISDQQIALQREQFNKNVELQQPMVDAGNAGRNRLMQLLGLTPGGEGNGSAVKDFSMSDFTSDPGYQFRMDQGQQALERSAAARGGLMSGAALKDTARFSQGLASQDYQAAFDRFKSNQASKINPLQSISGAGQTASNALGQAGQNFATTASQSLGNYGTAAGANLTGMGNARASGYVGTANALTGGLSQAYNGLQQNQLMNMLNKPPSLGGSIGSSASYANNDFLTS